MARRAALEAEEAQPRSGQSKAEETGRTWNCPMSKRISARPNMPTRSFTGASAGFQLTEPR
jgi:hypothetical protein